MDIDEPLVHCPSTSMNTVYGIHSVEEVVKSRPKNIHYVAMAKQRHDLKLQRILEQCRVHGIQVRFVEKFELEKLANTGAHQGVVAVTQAKQYLTLDDLLEGKRNEKAFLLVLDGVEDPHNL